MLTFLRSIVLGCASCTPTFCTTPADQSQQDSGDVVDSTSLDLGKVRAALAGGDIARARQLLAELEKSIAGSPGEEVALGPGRQSLEQLAELAARAGASPVEVRVRERLVEVLDTTLGAEHTNALAARSELAKNYYRRGEIRKAHGLNLRVHGAFERVGPPESDNLLTAKQNLAVTYKTIGDLESALRLEQYVHDVRERTLGAKEAYLLLAKQNLAITLKTLGNLDAALALEEFVVEAREEALDSDHQDLLAALLNLAVTRKSLGDVVGALSLEERVHAVRDKTLAYDDPQLLRIKENLSVSRAMTGDLLGALELLEDIYRLQLKVLVPEDPGLIRTKGNLGLMRMQSGDYAGARELLESVYEALGRMLPEDHPDLLNAEQHLAVMRDREGDVEGAFFLFERTCRKLADALPKDHPGLLKAQQNLGVALAELGDLVAARQIFESVLEIRRASLADDHPDVLELTSNLGLVCQGLGDTSRALELQLETHAARVRSLPRDHPDLLSTKTNLASAYEAAGESEQARMLWEVIYRARRELWPHDHPELLETEIRLGLARLESGDADLAMELLEWIPPRVQAAVRRAALMPARRSTAMAQTARNAAVLARSLLTGERDNKIILMQLAAALESTRLAVGGRATMRRGGRSQAHEDITAASAAQRSAQAAMERHVAAVPRISSGPSGRDDTEWRETSDRLQAEWTRQLAGLRLELDEKEAAVLRLLEEEGMALTEVDLRAVADALRPGDVAIGIHRMNCWEVDAIDEDGSPSRGYRRTYDGEYYIAYVVEPSGEVSEVDLGKAEPIDDLVTRWHAALGASRAARGGLRRKGGVPNAADSDRIGRALRRLVLDPLLAAGKPRPGGRIHVCLDGALHTVPLDAMPLAPNSGLPAGSIPADGTPRVGDHYDFRPEISFSRLLVAEVPLEGASSLTVVGGVDFAADPERPADLLLQDTGLAERTLALADAASEENVQRAGGWRNWGTLPGATEEARAIGELAKVTLGLEATKLGGANCTPAALERAFKGKRYVHVATHGWFMPETVRSMLDGEPDGNPRTTLMGTERTVTGFAPEALCGLVLSGASAAESSEELSARLLSAMALASFDLWDCELAVLSACETNVGIIRAGQGIHSLQAALHRAGARASVTSLWKVDDAATQRLMTAFYTNLWAKGMGKAEALWNAKCQLRKEGQPPRNWAGWVLFGDPE